MATTSIYITTSTTIGVEFRDTSTLESYYFKFEIYDPNDTLIESREKTGRGNYYCRFYNLQPYTMYRIRVSRDKTHSGTYIFVGEISGRTYIEATFSFTDIKDTSLSVSWEGMSQLPAKATYKLDNGEVIESANLYYTFSGLTEGTHYFIYSSIYDSNNNLLSSASIDTYTREYYVFLGHNYETLERYRKATPYSKVVILTGQKNEDDEDIIYTAGTDTGLTLEINNPFGTQAMANAILSRINGFSYQPYDVANGLLDPAAEIGDGLSVGGLYSTIFSLNQDYGLLLTSDISAPAGDEEEEYDYKSKAERSYARTISELKTELKIQNGLIEGRITYEDAETLISQNIQSITLSATNGQSKSTLVLSADGVQIDSAEITFTGLVDFVTDSDLSTAGRTTINGGNITTGTISASRIAVEDIAEVNKTLTIGKYGENSKIIMESSSTGGIESWMYMNGSTLTLRTFSGEIELDSSSTVTINGDEGLVVISASNTDPSYNLAWGTSDPATVFANAGVQPTTGQVYIKITN